MKIGDIVRVKEHIHESRTEPCLFSGWYVTITRMHDNIVDAKFTSPETESISYFQFDINELEEIK